MEEFLNKLYSYEYFGTYLMISIVVLLLIFVIILFFGKKDQKNREIEATKKLQRISSEDAFKEESSLQSVEVKKDENTVPLDDTIIVPNINNVPPISNPEPTELSTQTLDNTPINFDNQVEKEKPMESQNIPNEVEVPNNINTDVTPNIALTEAKEETVGPVLEKEEEKPFVFASNETTPIINDNHSDEIYPFVNNSFEDTKIEDVKVEEDNNEETIRVPQFNFDEIINSSEPVKEEVETPKPEIQRGPQIFSSVYAPKQEEVDVKEEVKVPSSDELDIELPILKSSIEKNKEEKIEPPVLQDYNLDSISGETYDIK